MIELGSEMFAPMMACLRLESTGKMFFSTSSIGPGRWAIFSFRLSASRALFSFIWVACREGSAPVSGGQGRTHGGHQVMHLIITHTRNGRVMFLLKHSLMSVLFAMLESEGDLIPILFQKCKKIQEKCGLLQF